MGIKKSLSSETLGSLSRLSSRERLLVVFTALVAVVFLFAGSIYFVQGRLHKAERRVRERTAQLQQILDLEGRFRNAQKDQGRIESRMKRNNVQLFSLLPKVAGELGLTLNDLNERRTPLKDSNIDEISVDVNLKKMSIDKLDGFLERVEQGSSDGMVKVLKIKVKTRFDDENLLDVNMKVATYKPSSSS